MVQTRAVQAQHTAMMEELDSSRQREQAATQAAAVDRRGNSMIWTSWHRHEVAWETERVPWRGREVVRVAHSLSRVRRAPVRFVDELVDLVDADENHRNGTFC